MGKGGGVKKAWPLHRWWKSMCSAVLGRASLCARQQREQRFPGKAKGARGGMGGGAGKRRMDVESRQREERSSGEAKGDREKEGGRRERVRNWGREEEDPGHPFQ
eukprot:354497-Chlamydomonas_euryale.AAC.4